MGFFSQSTSLRAGLAPAQPKTINLHRTPKDALSFSMQELFYDRYSNSDGYVRTLMPSRRGVLALVENRGSMRMLLRLVLPAMVLCLLAFGASRMRPHARTPFCYADAATAQDVLHSPIAVIAPAVIHSRPSLKIWPVFQLSEGDHAMLSEAVLPSLLRAPPVFRI